MAVENVVIEYRDRPEGSESKLNTISDGIKVLMTILRLFRTYKPMKFFGIVSFVLAVLGFGFMIPVLIEYFQTGLVLRFPTLIVCCFSLLTAVRFFPVLFLRRSLGKISRTLKWNFSV
mgnify:CR=1 FL=1